MNSNIFANNIGDLSIARDEEGKVLIFSDLKCCHRFEKSFLAWLRANGLGKVLRNDDIDVPVRPLRAIARQLNGNPKHGDKHKIKDWEHKNDRWESLCEKTLAVLKRALDNPVKEYLRGVITDLDLATREIIRLILQEMTNRYGGYSQEKAELNFHMMRTIPNFTSVSTTNNGLQRMSELIEDRIAYRVKEEEWTDKQMRGFLLSKCREWQELSFEVGMIDRQPDMKYTEAKSAILQTVNRLANSAIVESIQAREMAARVNPLYARQGTVDNMGDKNLQNSSEQSSADAWFGAAAAMQYERSSKNCYNCHVPGHFARDCEELWCSKCRKQWTSTDQPGYHLCRNCPEAPLIGEKRKANTPAPVVRPFPPWLQQPPQEDRNASVTSRGRGRTSRTMRGPYGASRWPPTGTGLQRSSQFQGNMIEEQEIDAAQESEDCILAWQAYASSLEDDDGQEES